MKTRGVHLGNKLRPQSSHPQGSFPLYNQQLATQSKHQPGIEEITPMGVSDIKRSSFLSEFISSPQTLLNSTALLPEDSPIEIPHGDLQPQTIHLDLRTNTIKIMPPVLLQSSSGFQKMKISDYENLGAPANSGREYEAALSPILLKGLAEGQPRPQHQPFLSDVFGAGISIFSLCVKRDFRDYYDYTGGRIHWDLIKNDFKMMRKMGYSRDLVAFLQGCLEKREEKRLTLRDLALFFEQAELSFSDFKSIHQENESFNMELRPANSKVRNRAELVHQTNTNRLKSDHSQMMLAPPKNSTNPNTNRSYSALRSSVSVPHNRNQAKAGKSHHVDLNRSKQHQRKDFTEIPPQGKENALKGLESLRRRLNAKKKKNIEEAKVAAKSYRQKVFQIPKKQRGGTDKPNILPRHFRMDYLEKSHKTKMRRKNSTLSLSKAQKWLVNQSNEDRQPAGKEFSSKNAFNEKKLKSLKNYKSGCKKEDQSSLVNNRPQDRQGRLLASTKPNFPPKTPKNVSKAHAKNRSVSSILSTSKLNIDSKNTEMDAVSRFMKDWMTKNGTKNLDPTEKIRQALRVKFTKIDHKQSSPATKNVHESPQTNKANPEKVRRLNFSSKGPGQGEAEIATNQFQKHFMGRSLAKPTANPEAIDKNVKNGSILKQSVSLFKRNVSSRDREKDQLNGLSETRMARFASNRQVGVGTKLKPGSSLNNGASHSFRAIAGSKNKNSNKTPPSGVLGQTMAMERQESQKKRSESSSKPKTPNLIQTKRNFTLVRNYSAKQLNSQTFHKRREKHDRQKMAIGRSITIKGSRRSASIPANLKANKIKEKVNKVNHHKLQNEVRMKNMASAKPPQKQQQPQNRMNSSRKKQGERNLGPLSSWQNPKPNTGRPQSDAKTTPNLKKIPTFQRKYSIQMGLKSTKTKNYHKPAHSNPLAMTLFSKRDKHYKIQNQQASPMGKTATLGGKSKSMLRLERAFLDPEKKKKTSSSKLNLKLHKGGERVGGDASSLGLGQQKVSGIQLARRINFQNFR